MNHVLFAIIAGSGFALSSVLGLFGIRVSNTARLASVAIAAGILLAIAFADLLPEAFANTTSARAAFAFAAGFLLLFLVETVTHTHTHHHDPTDGHDHHHDQLAAHHAILPFCLGLALHNLTDGLVIGASAELSGGVAAGVTVGMLVHQLPVGISFAAVLHARHAGRSLVLRLAIALGLVIPIGAGIVAALGTLAPDSLGILLGGAAGALTYVATGHLLPETQTEERHKILGITFAATLLLSVWWFTVLVPG